jgi:hypothetical protein
MEADWEFEIAADAPVIDAAWSGLIDLRLQPERARQLPEAERMPELAEALIWLNAADSPFWTAKCDVWEPGRVDADEFDAPSEQAGCAIACYIDLLPANEQTWATLDLVADWCRGVCSTLRALPLRQCRADLLIRRAYSADEPALLGITVYLAACAATLSAAEAVLGSALHAFVDTAGAATCSTQPDKSYNE